MCEYCSVNLENGDQITGLNNIMVIHDGNLEISVDLYNSKSISGANTELNHAELWLRYGGHGSDPISDTDITIKYCPFCGEEL